jgi:hypothetical protein
MFRPAFMIASIAHSGKRWAVLHLPVRAVSSI